MDIVVIDKNYEMIEVIDYYESLIWTERCFESGDFEISLMADVNVFGVLEEGHMLYYKGCNQVMLLEQLNITTDVEDGDRLKISGRSLESLLDRRVIWPQIDIHGSLHDGIKKLVTDNAISPSDGNRKIPNLYWEDSTDSRVLDIRLDAQYMGENLYDTISSLCKANRVCFRIKLTDDFKMVAYLFYPDDHSYSQEDLDYVIFSPKFENISSSDYIESNKNLKNVCYIKGDVKNNERRSAVVDRGKSGLERRETYVDGSSVSNTTSSGRQLTAVKYNAALMAKGEETLVDKVATKSFDGKVENGQTFVYGEHYKIGDVVQIVDSYGHEGQSRVTEFIHSEDSNGIESYPNFEMITSQLPQDYVELQYIKLENAYVDTLYKCNVNTKVVTIFTVSKSSNTYIHAFGNSGDSNFPMYFSIYSSGKVAFAVDTDVVDKTDTTRIVLNERQSLDVDSPANKLTLNDPEEEAKNVMSDPGTRKYMGYEYSLLTTRSGTATNNLLIGARSTTDYSTTDNGMIMYKFQIYDNGSMVRNFIPCINPDLVVGLYDTINNKFYQSSTATPLIAGPRAA